MPWKTKEAQNAYRRAYNATPDGRRKRRTIALRYKYGITADDYDQMWVEQEGRCAICVVAFDSEADGHVDHDHATKRVRGLLCGPCNKALGLMRDDPATLRAASEYVERNSVTRQDP